MADTEADADVDVYACLRNSKLVNRGAILSHVLIKTEMDRNMYITQCMPVYSDLYVCDCLVYFEGSKVD